MMQVTAGATAAYETAGAAPSPRPPSPPTTTTLPPQRTRLPTSTTRTRPPLMMMMATSPRPPQQPTTAAADEAASTSATYRGVSNDPATNMWRARIYCLGRHVTLGRFATADEAAFVHDRAAVFIHGETAQTNFGIEAAEEANKREPPSSSWRVMTTLETLSRESKARRVAASSGDMSRTIAAHHSVGPRALALAAAATMQWMDDESALIAAVELLRRGGGGVAETRASAAAAAAADAAAAAAGAGMTTTMMVNNNRAGRCTSSVFRAHKAAAGSLHGSKLRPRRRLALRRSTAFKSCIRTLIAIASREGSL